MTKQINNNIEVSIVIVCMNNLKNLYPCLEGIKKYTSVSYECFVVAYLFSRGNLEKVKKDFPWVKFIESNEIRGFSENNNLALRQAKGKYCYVLNDDTLMDSPVIDKLVGSIEKMPDEVAVLSPNIKYPDGRPQFCGRNKATFWTFLKSSLGFHVVDSQFTEKRGVFKTYNLMGAAFLVKTELFRLIGFFDEFYFFCPEDIDVSTKLNNLGYSCYVDADVVQYHIQGGTWSVMQTATEPAHFKGSIAFYSGNSVVKKILLSFIYIVRSLMRAFTWQLILLAKSSKKARIKRNMYLNVIKAIFSDKSPKEIFIKYYNEIREYE